MTPFASAGSVHLRVRRPWSMCSRPRSSKGCLLQVIFPRARFGQLANLPFRNAARVIADSADVAARAIISRSTSIRFMQHAISTGEAATRRQPRRGGGRGRGRGSACCDKNMAGDSGAQVDKGEGQRGGGKHGGGGGGRCRGRKWTRLEMGSNQAVYLSDIFEAMCCVAVE
jgi:hypothetical protein